MGVRRIGTIVGLFLALAAFSLYGFHTNKNFTIGVSLPLSGEYAFIGEEMRRGVELALDDTQVRAVFEDNQYDPKTMVSAAQKLVTIDDAVVAATFSLTEAKVSSKVFADAGVPLLVFWDSDSTLYRAGDHIFSNGFSAEGDSEKLANYAYTVVGARSTAVVGDVDETIDVFVKAFSAEFERLGGEVVLTVPVQIGETDYRTVLAKLKQANPDSIYFPILPPSNIIFVRQLQELGIRGHLFSADTFVEDVVHELGGAGDGIYFHNYLPEDNELVRAYIARYGSHPANLNYAKSAYDGTKVILAAHEKNQNSIKDGLLSVLGDDRSANRVQPLYQVQNGKSVLVEE
ncbi:MAG: penicillin-binding protein activator [Patescibacteria group bacterium]